MKSEETFKEKKPFVAIIIKTCPYNKDTFSTNLTNK